MPDLHGKGLKNHLVVKVICDFDSMLRQVQRFHQEITNQPVPSKPIMLTGKRQAVAYCHMDEELDEFDEATTLEGQADALIDLIYVALGRLLEMGIAPGPIFEEVHNANMNKVPGIKEGREDNQFDAVKPEGWQGPSLFPLLQVGLEDYTLLSNMRPALLDAAKLVQKKAEDYTSSESELELEDYFPFEERSYCQMIWTKVCRLRSLVGSNLTPNFESIRSTLLDTINYCSFWVEHIDKKDEEAIDNVLDRETKLAKEND